VPGDPTIYRVLVTLSMTQLLLLVQPLPVLLPGDLLLAAYLTPSNLLA